MTDKASKTDKNFKKILTDTYVSDRVRITEDEAIKELTNSEFVIKQLNHDKEEDEELQAAKAIAKDLNAGYTAAVKYEKAKIDFLLEKIEEQRILKNLTTEDKEE